MSIYRSVSDKYRGLLDFIRRSDLGIGIHPAFEGEYNLDYNLFWREWLGWREEAQRESLRYLFYTDLFFLIYYGFGRRDINNHATPFLLRCCREVRSGPVTDTVDLWFRGAYKSTIITQALTLQDLLRNPGFTVGIFSNTRPLAKDHLLPIKTTLENSALLRWAFPDILYFNPRVESPAWSLDAGLQLRRQTTGNTRSLEAWGLVDGQPTGKHFDIRVYDDVITEKTVTTHEQLKKAESAFRLSDNLASAVGWQRIIGTTYSYADYYSNIREEAEKGIYPWHVRIKPWYHETEGIPPADVQNLPPDYLRLLGLRKPVLHDYKQIVDKRVKQGPYIFAAQMELNPSNRDMVEFRVEWLRYYRSLPTIRNKYVFIDPANEKKRDSSYTVMALISIDPQGNRFLEHIVRDKLNLGERWDALSKIIRQHPDVICVYYEKYAKDSDIWYMEQQQKRTGLYFKIEPIGGHVAKLDRIRRLVPIFEQGRFYLPEQPITYRGRDLVQEFINEEYSKFPYCRTMDMLDAIARIEDPEVEATTPSTSSRGGFEIMRDEFYDEISVRGL